MAGRSDIEAGRAFVRLYVKKNELLSGMKAGLKDIASFAAKAGAAIVGIGATATGAAMVAIHQFAETGDRLRDMALRTGTSVEALSQLGFVAEQSGTNLEGIETGLRKMQKTLSDAAGGSATARKALSDLGITADMLREPPDAQLEMFADKINAIKDPAARAGAAMEIFGKSGTELLPMFAEGAAGIRAMRKEADELGLSVSTEQADAADEFGDAWNRVKRGMGGIVFQIGAALAPAMTNILGIVKDAISYVSQWVRENAGLLQSFTDLTENMAAGNWALLGSIAVESMTVAIQDGIATLASWMGDGWGDILGTMSTNSMEENWNLAIQAMTLAWETFAAGVMSIFTDVAKAIAKIWAQTVGAIANKIVELAGAGGVVGSTLSKILGVDVAAERDRAAKLNAEAMRRGLATTDIDKIASDSIAQQLTATTDRINATLDGLNTAAAERAAESANAFGQAVVGGRSAISDAAAESRKHLEELQKQMADAAATRRKEKEAAVKKKPIETPDPMAIQKAESLVTYSATALAQAGTGGGIQGMMLKEQQESRKLAASQLEESRKSRKATEGIAAGLRFG